MNNQVRIFKVEGVSEMQTENEEQKTQCNQCNENNTIEPIQIHKKN